mgnify:CR=1 FL=1
MRKVRLTTGYELALGSGAALTTSDTISRKPSTNTRPNDSSRVRTTTHQVAPFGGGTCQISSRLSFSSANAVVAAKARMTAAAIAYRPAGAFRALVSSASTRSSQDWA